MEDNSVMESLTPYRLIVFAEGSFTKGKGKRARTTVRQGYAYMGWNPIDYCEPGRLEGSGSFLFPGLHVARSTAIQYLEMSEVQQVSIRTNQDQEVYRFYKTRPATQTQLNFQLE